MADVLNSLRGIDFLSVLFKMIYGLLVSGAIGLERSYKNRAAGFRTHILVCTGGVIASLTGLYLYLALKLPVDTSRIAASVVTGISFIGGGTIIVTRDKQVKGLTTAAGLWATGIIGLAIGAGFYEGALIAAVLIIMTEVYFAKISSRAQQTEEFRIAISCYEKSDLDSVLRFCKNEKLMITNLQVAGSKNENMSAYHALISLTSMTYVDKAKIIDKINAMDGIISAELLAPAPKIETGTVND